MTDRSKGPTPRWVLLLHQLPTRPAKARVKTWRRLQQIGAISLRNSAYVLPNTPQSHEDFEWMKSEIVAMGGQAAVFMGDTIDADVEAEIVAAFRAAREVDYKTLLRDLAVLERQSRSASRSAARAQSTALRRSVRACRDRLAQIAAIDFFPTTGRREAEAALATLERRALGTAAGHAAREAVDAGTYRRCTWVTRPRPGVDRMASAWLIRTFIDPEAVFVFGEKPSAEHVAFDMYDGEFSHHGDLCTFEVFERRFRIADPAVRRIGEIVHDLDLKDSRFQPPEAATVGALVEGLRAAHGDDDTALQHGIDLFDALYRSMTGSAPSSRTGPAPNAGTPAARQPRGQRAPARRRRAR
jgi:hypothetical protein